MEKIKSRHEKLECGHTLCEHQRMQEAKASAEIEGARTGKTICELIDMADDDTCESVGYG